MKKYYRVILSSLVMLLTACTTTSDITLNSEASPGITLSQYKTYQWNKSFITFNDPNNDWKSPST